MLIFSTLIFSHSATAQIRRCTSASSSSPIALLIAAIARWPSPYFWGGHRGWTVLLRLSTYAMAYTLGQFGRSIGYALAGILSLSFNK
jgi:hypothetical protein